MHRNSGFDCLTNQHQEMLDQVLDLFALDADYNLRVMTDKQTPTEVATRVLERLPDVLTATHPAPMLVQGDTTTTFAAALAAFYARIPGGHVEAGLRTWRKDAPFPEEINRTMTTALTEWHFAPTEWARENLLREGVASAWHPPRTVISGSSASRSAQRSSSSA